MPRPPSRRRLVTALAAILAVLAVATWWLFYERAAPAGSFALDLAEVRRLADSLPGDKPAQVRFERVATFRFPHIAVVAGSGWGATEMPVFAWQLVYPDRTVLVDSAMNEATTREGGGEDFSEAAFARVQQGLEQASLIVFTHEHFDHLGGLIASPHLEQALHVALLTREQQAHPEKMVPASFPPGVLEAQRPLVYETAVAVAPGVVLIKAPGHTPGSQLVYVRRADGRELLFLGDVAWHLENVEGVAPRANLVSKVFLQEDRDQVHRELVALHALATAEPTLALVPGHDGPAVAALVAAGLAAEQFEARPRPAAP